MSHQAKQSVYITAGASGIGRAIAHKFANAGAEVFVCDVDEEALEALKAEVSSIEVVTADVSNPAVVARFLGFPNASERFQVLVNNAGVAGPRGYIEDVEIDAWLRTLDVNLTGAFLCMQHAARGMKRAGAGAIINIVTASVRTGLPSRSAYIASKAGLLGLSHNAARELGPYGVRVNAVLPGNVDGSRSAAVIKKIAVSKGLSVEEVRERALSTVSMRTTIQPEEVAAMVHWLSGPDAAHISGQAIGVDGNLEWEE